MAKSAKNTNAKTATKTAKKVAPKNATKAKTAVKRTPEEREAALAARLAERETAKAERTAKREARTIEVTNEIVTRREAGAKWAEISEALNLDIGRVRQYYLLAAATEDRAKFAALSPKAQRSAIVKFRDKNRDSWGTIVGKTGIPQGRVQKMYAEATDADWRAGYSVISARATAKAEAKAKTTGTKNKRTA